MNEKQNKKESYWSTYYSPFGIYANNRILPILYILLLLGILGIIFLIGYYKIIGGCFCVIPIYFIIYDYLYKKEQKKTEQGMIDDTHFINSYGIITKTFKIISAAIFGVVLVVVFYKIPGILLKMIFLPIFACGFSGTIYVIARNLELNYLSKILKKIITIFFILYIFGFIIFWFIGFSIQEGSFAYAIIAIPFLLLIVYLMRDKLFSKKNK